MPVISDLWACLASQIAGQYARPRQKSCPSLPQIPRNPGSRTSPCVCVCVCVCACVCVWRLGHSQTCEGGYHLVAVRQLGDLQNKSDAFLHLFSAKRRGRRFKPELQCCCSEGNEVKSISSGRKERYRPFALTKEVKRLLSLYTLCTCQLCFLYQCGDWFFTACVVFPVDMRMLIFALISN